MAGSLPPFTSLLLSLVLVLFPFPSFSQNSSLISFSSLCHLSENFITHLLRSNNPLCRRWKMKVLPTIRGKRSQQTILFPKPWVKRLPSLNWTTPRRRIGIVTQRFIGPLWLLPLPILIYVKGHHFPYPFSFSMGRAPFLVGRSRWIRSCPMRVSWRRYSRPVYWRP